MPGDDKIGIESDSVVLMDKSNISLLEELEEKLDDKIQKALLRVYLENRSSEAIVRTIIALVEKLNRKK